MQVAAQHIRRDDLPRHDESQHKKGRELPAEARVPALQYERRQRGQENDQQHGKTGHDAAVAKCVQYASLHHCPVVFKDVPLLRKCQAKLCRLFFCLEGVQNDHGKWREHEKAQQEAERRAQKMCTPLHTSTSFPDRKRLVGRAMSSTKNVRIMLAAHPRP